MKNLPKVYIGIFFSPNVCVLGMSLNRDKEVIIVRVYILCEKSSVFDHYIVTCCEGGQVEGGIDFIVDIGGMGGGVKMGVCGSNIISFQRDL